MQNVMLPMDLAGKYKSRQRRERAEHLLELVGLADQKNKLPSMVSGGQQQHAANRTLPCQRPSDCDRG